ncbi:cytochrome C biogenesis protein [Parerythrobacter aurantius]|uniref:tetratricopeptide repeat protein n=1 Tax=Parerythrobacter aurantius TaxID=3127706 RepID=UPI003254B3B3
MTGWIGAIIIGMCALAAGALLLRAQRSLWTLLAAVIVFGLAGYAWQGSPGYASAPAARSAQSGGGNTGLVDARREFFSPSDLPDNFVVFADGFARKGDFGRAARILQGVVAKNPEDGEAWLALGVALVEHADGVVTKPAAFALEQARAKLPGNPGPAFFSGVNALRAGNAPEARRQWVAGLQASTPEAEGREFVAERVLALDQLFAAMARQQQGQAPSAPAPQE